MTRFVSFLCCMLFAVAAYAQSDVNQYSFSYSEPGYSAISGGSIYGNASTDDQRFVDPAVPLGGTVNTGIGIPIGFDFTFLDEVYNRFAINANGWISLGQSSLSPAVNISSTSNFEMPLSSTAEILPDILVSRIVGFGTDLQAQAGSELRVQTIGAAPNRELVVQWTNYKKYGDGGNGDSFSFQIRLKETTNNFSFVYGTMLNNAFVAAAQVGLRSAPATTPTNWVCRTTTDNWAATQPGSSASSTMTISSIVFPASGSSYTWAPPLNNIPPDPAVLIAPADHALDVPLTQNLSWNPTGGTVIGYKLYFGTDDPPTNLANGIDLGNNTSYRPSQLLDDETQYKWKIVPYNGIGDALDCPVWTFTTGSAIMEFPYTQDFESWVPEGWSIDEGTYDFIQYTDANSNNWAEANFWDSPQGTTYYLVSPEFYTNSNLKLGFTWSHSCHPIYPDDALTVQVSADGETWEDLWYKTQTDFDSNDGDNYTIPGTGVNVSVDIPEQYLNTYFQIRFYALSGYGSNLFIDDVCVDVAAIEPSGAGTEADPYQIASLYNLLWLSNSPDAWDSYFLQTADIDASST